MTETRDIRLLGLINKTLVFLPSISMQMQMQADDILLLMMTMTQCSIKLKQQGKPESEKQFHSWQGTTVLSQKNIKNEQSKIMT